MKKLCAVLFGLLMTAWIAGPASAQVATGTLEICKASVSGTLAVAGPFSFTVRSGTAVVATRTVNVGQCSGAITVPAGTVTVTETVPVFASIVSVVQTRPTGPTSLVVTGSTVSVAVAPGGPETESLITFTNQLVTGTIEICKLAATGSGLSGNFTFSLTNADAAVTPISPLASTTVSVPVGGCSNPITIAAGTVRVTETDAGGAAGITVSPAGALLSKDEATATALIAVAPGSTSTTAPIVTFTNNSALLKVCKIAGAGVTLGTPFSFTATPPGVGGPAQPFTVTAGPAATGGNCVTVGTYRQGTTVSVAEAISAGTMVPLGGITVSPTGRIVAGSLNEGTRSVGVIVGSGTTIVTYTNIAAPPGTLKICKTAGAGVAAGAAFSFTVGTSSVTVLAGSCAIVGGPAAPTTFPFMSVQTITELATTPATVVSAIAVLPADRLVGTPNLAGRSVTASIGSPGSLLAPGETVVTFTNTTAPVVVPVTPTTPTTPTTGGTTGTSTTTTTTGGSGTTASAAAAATTSSSGTTASTGGVAGATAKTTALKGKTPSITKAHASIALARFVKFGNHRWVAVRVKSTAPQAKIRIVLLGSNSKAIGSYVRTIKSNSLVRVLKAGLTTHGMRVTIINR
jgi:hypothetical protein